jgi:hypothetical protein
MWLYFIPLYVVGALVVLFGILALLARVKGGRYVRPLFAWLLRVPVLKGLIQKASRAALERQNPELASAVKKLERSGVQHDPQRAQAALSRLTASERQAYLAAAEEQGVMPQPTNRAERRRIEKMRRAQRGGR